MQIFKSTNVMYGFTTSNSFGYDNFNLADYVGDSNFLVEQRHKFEQYLGVEVTYPNQVHGTNILNLDLPSSMHSADAVTTTKLDKPCVIFTADCLPILLYSQNRVAAVHCGWRSLAAGILSKTILMFEATPSAFLGPHIFQKNYEVSDSVAEVFFDNNFPKHIYTPTKDGHGLLDLKAAVLYECAKFGVVLAGGVWNTFDDEQLYSVRGNKPDGRITSFIVRTS